jgi:PAS domain-containing protein
VQPQLTQLKTLIKEVRTLQTPETELFDLQTYALESIANSIFITDTNGNIQWVNPAFSKINGYSAVV